MLVGLDLGDCLRRSLVTTWTLSRCLDLSFISSSPPGPLFFYFAAIRLLLQKLGMWRQPRRRRVRSAKLLDAVLGVESGMDCVDVKTSSLG